MSILEFVIVFFSGLAVFFLLHRAQRRMEGSHSEATWLAIAGGISMLAAWGVVRYFSTYSMVQQQIIQKEEQTTAEGIRAPVHAQVLVQPLMTEVDFINSETTLPTELIKIETPLIEAIFSTQGGMLISYGCKRSLDGKPGILKMYDIDATTEREQGGYLIALEQSTPLTYACIENKATDDGHRIIFRAESDQALIMKEFLFFNDSFRIDIKLQIRAKVNTGVRPRLFLTGPYLTEIADDTASAIIISDKGVFGSYDAAHVEARLWERPTLFGVADRYFVHALIHDTNSFMERAYYRLNGAQRITSILEGSLVLPGKEKVWHLSFYGGPKVSRFMEPVDLRLKNILNYGWFHPISAIFMNALQFFNRFVHNYGWSIILLILLLKLLLLPISISAEQGRKRMAEMQKRIHYIEKKYKDNPEVLEKEKIEIIRKYGVGDMFSSFFLIIVQILTFTGVQRILSLSYDLYRAPFILWIKDLSATDPYMIFPALVAIGIFMRMSTTGTVKETVQSGIMAIVIFGLMMNFSAGMVLSIFATVWFDIIQGFLQKYVRA